MRSGSIIRLLEASIKTRSENTLTTEIRREQTGQAQVEFNNKREKKQTGVPTNVTAK